MLLKVQQEMLLSRVFCWVCSLTVAGWADSLHAATPLMFAEKLETQMLPSF